LRARHLPFSIGEVERDAWMLCMEQAISEMNLDELLRQQLVYSLRQTADHMQNK
jgi:hemoglobin